MIKLSKSELNEGIDLDMVNTVVRKGKMSPCQLKQGEDPINVLECSSGYWVRLDDGSFLKDGNKLIVVTSRDVIVGRARYLLKHADDELEVEIQKEVLRLRQITKDKAEVVLKKSRLVMIEAGEIEVDGFEKTLRDLVINQDKGRAKINQAMASRICTPEFIETHNYIQSLYDNENYNQLYNVLFQNGVPQIASFDTTKELDITAFVNNFSASKIEKTIESVCTHDHLYNVAKFNVSKK